MIQMVPYTSKIWSGRNLFKRVHGIQESMLIETETIDFSIPYNHAKFVAIEFFNGASLDKCDFKVIDSPTGIFSGTPNAVLNQFAYTANIAKDYYIRRSSFDMDVYLGMVIRIIYTSVSIKTIGINYEMDEVK